jgi:branched-subunit amino acid aminotransferase/4-amino-4-deoxychorismate lyase
MRMKTFCLDLDGTLCTNTWGAYERALPFPWAIERVNALHRAGHRILIFTARGGTTGIDWSQKTRVQLRDWGVGYDELILGKPQADVYVDDRTVHVDAWRYGDALDVPVGTSFETSEHEMPALPPPRNTTVVEVGRTFGAEPFRTQEHARRVLMIAAEHEIPSFHTEEQICGGVRRAVQQSRQSVSPPGDVIFTIALGGPPHSAYLDTLQGGLDPRLTIGCRPVSQAANGVLRYLRSGAVTAGMHATAPLPDTWLLTTDTRGALRDVFGGEVVIANGNTLRVRPQGAHPEIALAQTIEFAAALGLRVEERAPTAGDVVTADEVLLIDFPFCLLPVGQIDHQPLPTAPGPIARRLASAWRERTGVDPAASWRR